MFVTNLANHPLGVDGIVILKPGEESRYIEETEDLVSRIERLKGVGLVTVEYEAGLVKDGLPTELEPEVKVTVTTEPETEVVTETKVVTTAKEEPAAKPKARGVRGAK